MRQCFKRKTKAIFPGWFRSEIRCQFVWSLLKQVRSQSHILVWNRVNVSSMCPAHLTLTSSEHLPRVQCHNMSWPFLRLCHPEEKQALFSLSRRQNMLIARNKLNFWGLLYECFVHLYSQLYVLFNNSFVMHCGRYNGSAKQWAQWLP